MERSGEVLSGLQIHARLAADRTVDLCDDGRGDLDERDTPLVDRGDETGEIADHPATQGNDERTPIESGTGHTVEQGFGRGEAFRRFPGADGQKHRIKSGTAQRCEHRVAVQAGDVLVGDHSTSSAQSRFRAQFPGAGNESGTDKHAARDARNVHRHFDGALRAHAVW